MVSCFFLKASQALLKVGLHSIFMKLALCEIGFCLMDPCMGAPPDTPASPPRHSGWRRTGSEKQGKKKKKRGGPRLLLQRFSFINVRTGNRLYTKRSRCGSASSDLLAAVPAEKVKQNTRIPREENGTRLNSFLEHPHSAPFISLALPRADQIANEAADIRFDSENHLMFGGGGRNDPLNPSGMKII